MTLSNRDLLYRDPTAGKIPNDGVANPGLSVGLDSERG